MRGIKLSRKGLTVYDLSRVALLVVLIGLTLGIGTWINQEVADQYDTISVLCESVTFGANATWKQLKYPYISSVNQIYNGSECGGTGTSMLLLAANYSYTDTHVNLTCTGTACGDGAPTVYVNYTAWNHSVHPDILIAKNATKGMSSLAQWLPILMVVIAGGVVIGTLILAFAFRR